jgi:RteC protein
MELLKISEELYVQLEDELESINGTLKSGFEKFSDSLFMINTHINQLKKLVSEQQFRSETEEITFFKNIFPKFYSWMIYTAEEYSIISAVPVGTEQMLRDYYLQELAIVKRNFNQSQFTYQYFLQGETALDEDYFLRKNFNPNHPGLTALFTENKMATNQGYQFARFRAGEMLQDFLINRIRLLYKAPDNVLLAELLTGTKRRWTGEKINLIELAYGIFYTGQMNDGKAEINDIVSWLEESLQVDLGRAYRKFVDIRRRKTLSYTKYLDEMRNAIHLKIDENDRYKPKPFKRATNEN